MTDTRPEGIQTTHDYTVVHHDGQVILRLDGMVPLPVGSEIELADHTSVTVRRVVLCTERPASNAGYLTLYVDSAAEAFDYEYTRDKLYTVTWSLAEHGGSLPEKLRDCLFPHLDGAFMDAQRGEKYPGTELERRLLALHKLIYQGDGEWKDRVAEMDDATQRKIVEEIVDLYGHVSELLGSVSPPEEP